MHCNRIADFANFLSEEIDAETLARLRSAVTIGRPLGNRKFLDMLERKTKRALKPAKRGAEAARSGEISALSP